MNINGVSNQDVNEYLYRPRVNALLAQAVNYPLVYVCAGTGYGKTRAVSDFIARSGIFAPYIALSEDDNDADVFWDKLIKAIERASGEKAAQVRHFGFPDTQDKMKLFVELRRRVFPEERSVMVFDDAHLISSPAVIRFFERVINETRENHSIILVCRGLPRINSASLEFKGLVYTIREEELRFTENELSLYFNQRGISADPNILRSIYHDTMGWALSAGIAAQSLKRTQAYLGYTRTAMKKNIFKLMETEVFDVISGGLRLFLVSLSLIEHHSADLIEILLNNDESLAAEFREQSAYIRYDTTTNGYLIHPFFLDFLKEKQEILSEELIRETYNAAALWCGANGFTLHALEYYEKVGDYESITSTLIGLPFQIPRDIASFALGVFERAPSQTFVRARYFAATHARAAASLGRLDDFFALAREYEAKLSAIAGDDITRDCALGALYQYWGCARSLMSSRDDVYDFDEYFVKFGEYLKKYPDELRVFDQHVFGAWFNMAGSVAAGAPERCVEAIYRSEEGTKRFYKGISTGSDLLSRGELFFYQGDIATAEPLIKQALTNARIRGDYEVIHRALYYSLRIAVYQGNRNAAEQTFRDIEALLSAQAYALRFTTYDIAYSWYQCFIRRSDKVSSWLKEDFTPYEHPFFIENFGNQIKARYHYVTKNFQPLLKYIDELKRRESILYNRIEMYAMEACVRYQLKEKAKAQEILREAYNIARPNNIVLPFIELGKDTRTLIESVLRNQRLAIPKDWLVNIQKKAAYYAKLQNLVITEQQINNRKDSKTALSQREAVIVRDLCNGLSRTEIASKQALSINTVNTAVNHIFDKLNANTIIDVIRIASMNNLL